MKLWIDDARPAPEGYIWIKSVNDAIRYIEIYGDYIDSDNVMIDCIELIDIDHDAGDYAGYCGYDDVTGPGKWIYDKKHSVFIKVGDA